jgi:hypothetical protein
MRPPLRIAAPLDDGTDDMTVIRRQGSLGTVVHRDELPELIRILQKIHAGQQRGEVYTVEHPDELD